MSRGVVLVAHNNNVVNYYKMAIHAAGQITKHLGLPVTVITDVTSLDKSKTVFDNTILVEPNVSNKRSKNIWINKNRFKVFDLSPYDETLVLDTDYLVNSDRLLWLFKQQNDFMVHNSVRWLMEPQHIEYIGSSGLATCWATVIFFRKTVRSKLIFDMVESIQSNYEHYANIYGFLPHTFRNDYAITIALKTVNGHIEHKEDFIPWNLVHVNKTINVKKDSDIYTLTQQDKDKKWHLNIHDLDFHMISKSNYLGLFNE